MGEQLPQRMQRIVEGIAAGLRAEAFLNYQAYLPPLFNNDRLTALVEQAALEILPSEQVVRLDLPRLAGEDFAYMAQRVPACFVFLGQAMRRKGSSSLLIIPIRHRRGLPAGGGGPPQPGRPQVPGADSLTNFVCYG